MLEKLLKGYVEYMCARYMSFEDIKISFFISKKMQYNNLWGNAVSNTLKVVELSLTPGYYEAMKFY